MRSPSTARASRGSTCRWWDDDHAAARLGHARRAARDLGRRAGRAGRRGLGGDRRVGGEQSAGSSPSGRTVYGVNTGFGILAQTRIPDDRLAELQTNLILSHSCGLGEALDPRIVRLLMVLKAIGLARGHSGVRREVVERLLALVEADALPVIPGQGSVGASGDLAPLAHMSAALLGEGEIVLGGERLPRRRGAGASRARAARARAQGRAGADQRHPGLDRDRARRVVHRRARVRIGADRRRAVDRRAEGHRRRRSIRASTPRAASPGRSTSPRVLRGLLDGQRDPPHRTTIATGCRTPTASAASRR